MRRELTAKAVSLVAAMGMVAGLTVANATPASAAPRWYVVPSPSPPGPPDGALYGVSCASANDCFAVGDGETGALIERWNGTSWRYVASPKPKGAVETSLSAVTCTSPTNCFAVGSTFDFNAAFSSTTLIERWDGSRWTIMPSPNPAGGVEVNLSAVSCSSANDCFAVGASASLSTSPFSIVATPLIVHWNGVTWSIVPSPSPSGTVSAQLHGVACPGPTNCFAVGSYQGRATGGALVEHWNGSKWSIVPNPDAVGAARATAGPQLDLGFGSSPSLFSISCSSPTSCFAVGESFSGSALIERWDGTSWSIMDSPSPRNAFGVALLGVSCVSATDCSAVGTAGIEIDLGGGGGGILGEGGSPVTEHWNGTNWAIVPQPAGSFYSELRAVSCPTTTYCAAVGDSALVQRWNGTSWSIAPFAAKTSQSHLNQVACPSAKSCFAVGGYEANTSASTLIEHWNGSKWSIMPSPEPKGALEVELIGIDCPTTTSCFAVGYSATSFAPQPLIEHWNGKQWSIMTNPAMKDAPLFAELTSVSCPAANDCTAVGSALGLSSPGKPLIARWNGKKWSVVPTPTPAANTAQLLEGVSCTSKTDCTAVGAATTISGTTPTLKPLVQHWNGTTWSVVPTPAAGSPLAILITVSCSSATNCLAVGISAGSDFGATKAFVEHWNGTSWKVVKTPSLPGATESALIGVACRSARSCYAVGGYSTPSGDKTLVEHWDGKALSVVPSPSPGNGSDTALTGIACPTPASCMAVGAYSSRNGSFTLTLRGS